MNCADSPRAAPLNVIMSHRRKGFVGLLPRGPNQAILPRYSHVHVKHLIRTAQTQRDLFPFQAPSSNERHCYLLSTLVLGPSRHADYIAIRLRMREAADGLLLVCVLLPPSRKLPFPITFPPDSYPVHQLLFPSIAFQCIAIDSVIPMGHHAGWDTRSACPLFSNIVILESLPIHLIMTFPESFGFKNSWFYN